MKPQLKYNLAFPEKVNDILELDFWIFDGVTSPFLKSIDEPMRFSAATSIFLRAGRCKVDINLMETEIVAPCVVNINSDHYLSLREVSDEFSACFIVFSQRMTNDMHTLRVIDSVINNYSPRQIMPIRQEHVDAYERYYHDMKAIMTDNANPGQYHAALYRTMSFWHATGAKDAKRKSQLDHNQASRITDQFMALVRQYFRSEHFINFYADKLEMTPKHLSRTIKAQTGYSAGEWIERFLLVEAKVMLRSSALNVQQISTQLNFPSQSTFGKFFKKNTGVSPKEYRNT